MKKIKTLIIILLSVMIIATISQGCYIRFSHKIEVKSYEQTTLSIPSTEQTLTKSTAKQLIKKLYDTPHIYKEKDLKNGNLGRTMAFFRLIEIDPDLTLNEYVITYAHELTHVKYQTNNETWVSYKTFVILYESGNAELRNMALRDAQRIINGGYRGTDYDCGYYILEYLKNKGE